MSAPAPPTILIVDDDRGLNRLIERALTRQGFACRSALTGTEALSQLQQAPPDLMLLDLKLPDLETKDLLDRAAALAQTVPFLVITGQGDERVAVEMMKRGALDYLVKDAEFLEFVPIVVERTLAQLHREARLAAAEEGLRREHAFSMAVLKAAGALMVVADAQWRVISVNPACQRLLGHGLEDLAGKPFGELLMGGSAAQAVQRNIKKLAKGTAYEHEAYLTAKSGERRLIAWSITAHTIEDGVVDYIIASGLDITERRRLEQEILEVSDREQKRIGQDLHDGLCQVLAGINMLAVVLKNDLTAKARPEAADADAIASYASKAITEARAVSRGLSPVELETHGLMAALEELAGSTIKLFQVQCTFVCTKSVLMPDNAKATHLYRIAQEAIGNAVKHGGAKAVTITLESDNGRGSLVIADDGRGLPAHANEMPGRGKGMGLRTMNYRAAIIGATLTLQPNQPHGTRVVCSFPLATAAS